MKFKKLLISSIVLFVLGVVASFVTLLQVYGLAGTDMPQERALAQLDKYQTAITLSRFVIIAAVILLVIWTILLVKESNGKRTK